MLLEYMRKSGLNFEVVFVENGSTDATPQKLRALAQNNEVRIETLKERDYSKSILQGISSARGDYIITMGIDFTDLTIIDRCMASLATADIVICSKNLGIDSRPIARRIANRGYNALARMAFGIEFSDIEGYHGLKRRSIENIVPQIYARAHLFNLWLLLLAKREQLIVTEVPLFVREVRPSRFSHGPIMGYLAFLSLIEFAKLKGRGF